MIAWPIWGMSCNVEVRRARSRRLRILDPNKHDERGDHPSQLALLLSKALHDAGAGDRVVDDADHLGHTRLRLPLRGVHLGAHPKRQPEQERDDRHHRDGEQRREHEHDPEREEELQQVRQHRRHLGEQLADERQVGVGARDELAGLHLVVTGEVETLQMAEHRVAQVVVDVPCDPTAEESSHPARKEESHDEQRPP